MTKRPNLQFDRLSGLYLLVVFVVVFGVLRPDIFLTMDTVHLLASGQALNGLVATAVLIPMICGHFDLSVGANANLAAMVAVQLQVEKGVPVLSAVAIAVAIGIAIGIANGFIVVKLGVSSFIATLGMASVLTAFQTMVTKSQLPPVPESSLWSAITQKEVFGFQVVFLYLLVAVVIAWWVLEHTPVGRYMMATGSNLEAARLSGVRTDVWSWASLVAAGGISAFAGVLYVSLTGPSVSFGNSLVLPAFAAVFLGSTQLKPGRFNILGTVLAIFVLATGVLGLQLLTSISWINDMFNGVAVIAAVALAVARRPGARPRLRRRRAAPLPSASERDDTGTRAPSLRA
ncbi:ABC transporter permease [Amycolatopsis sp. ATCC 39116]|uniref:ABC transporter permease n=1 Tax=Amycolatopsis sp. (strain ATCC 39116 / 75iv2) TaxID=385957 RepID=UPI0002625575|nr:ABC transporter permease [Amycolatopsis sp. ATCC 39116]